MPSSTKTEHLQLNQWGATDAPKRVDFNSDNQKVDQAIKNINGTFATKAYVDSVVGSAGGSGGSSGENGATFTPSVSSDAILSWSNNKGLPNPSPVNIRGPAGKDGSTEAQGPAGKDGLTTSVNDIKHVNGNINLSATSIPISSITGMSATNVQEALAENFQSVVSGKQSLETAIIDKGGTVSKNKEVATFSELQSGIATIDSAVIYEANDNLPPHIENFFGKNVSTVDNGKILVHWDAPLSEYYDGISIVRKLGSYPTGINDGTTIYKGNGLQCESIVDFDTDYGFRAYPYNLKGQYQTDITDSIFMARATESIDISDIVAIGSKIIFGRYKGEELKWVAVDINHKSYPADSITLTTERAIAYKTYGAKRNDKIFLATYNGSLIHQWLISSEKASDSSVYSEAGFLYEFSIPEREIIMTTTLKCIESGTPYNNLYSLNVNGAFLPSATETNNMDYSIGSGNRARLGTQFAGFSNGTVPVSGLGRTRQAWKEMNPDVSVEPSQAQLDESIILYTRDLSPTVTFYGAHMGKVTITDELKTFIKPFVNIDLHTKCRPILDDEGYIRLAL